MSKEYMAPINHPNEVYRFAVNPRHRYPEMYMFSVEQGQFSTHSVLDGDG